MIPAYNEGAAIAAVLEGLRKEFSHVVVVDDGSTDETFAIASRGGAHALRHLINRGQGAALRTGIEYSMRAGADMIVTFDADGQHRVEDIHALLQPLREGQCEITLGSRFLGSTVNLPKSRWLVLRLGVLFTRIFSRLKVTDTHNGLRAFTRRAAAHLKITMDRMDHASEIMDLIHDSRLPYREVPVQIRYTEHSLGKGQSSWDALRIAARYLIHKVTR